MRQEVKIQMRSFFNSFLRDFAGESFVSVNPNYFQIHLSHNEYLKINFSFYSYLGSHHYKRDILIHDLNGQNEISFIQAVDLIREKVFQADKEFTYFVQNSLDFLAQIKERKTYSALEDMDYIISEQSLLNGHPFHPYPKAKLGMELCDINNYGPEFGAKIQLLWAEVPKELLSSNADFSKSLNLMKEFDLETDYQSKNLIPYHPWQWQQLTRENSYLKEFSTYIGLHHFDVLSSMRSVLHKEAPFSLKFSMNIKITNSVRHLQSDEANRGKHLYDIAKKINLDEKYSNLKIIHEPFYLGLKNSNGDIAPETIILFRENDFDLKPHTYLLSTLVEFDFANNESLIWNYVKRNSLDTNKWFKLFLENCIRPIMHIGSEQGIYLGAHLQNILIELNDGYPVYSYFRDCQGTGYEESKLDKELRCFPELKNDKGNILNDEAVNHIFGYYLIVNTVFGVMSALSNQSRAQELNLLNLFRDYLRDLKTPFAKYLLESASLSQKGNFRCCVQKLNENTIESPWRIYNMIENPIANTDRKIFSPGILYTKNLDNGWELSFENFDLDKHLDIFHKWHQQDYVSEFWELNQTKKEQAEYIKKIKTNPHHEAVIVNVNNTPAGYYEVYWASEDRIAPFCEPKYFDRGIHLLIGESKYLKTRLAYDSIKYMSDFLFQFDKRTLNIWGEPRHDNKPILHLAQKLPGWNFVKEFSFPHKKAALLQCDRESFTKEFLQ